MNQNPGFESTKSIWKKDVHKELIPEIIQRLRGEGVKISPEVESKLAEHIDKMGAYTPRIGFFGKTGSGKSSLCNEVFGEDVAKIDVVACTREPSEYFIKLSENKSICLVDVPGIGENLARHDEYKKLYENLVSNSSPLDAILWILKADDRAYSADEDCWKQVVHPCLKENLPVIVVLNQVDKFNPLDWHKETNEPSADQAKEIEKTLLAVCKQFGVDSSQTIAVSAYRKYNLVELVNKLISALPGEKKLRVLEFTKDENRSEESEKEAAKGFVQHLMDYLSKAGVVVGKVWEKHGSQILEIGCKIALAILTKGKVKASK
jgi:uncharacterized protein